ncbi:predicted protein [Nematostella vectensis]|uniref:SEFIR domain-containing protein n=1 Tax=Nematostella vectensis TaxID=45351 RepID=A7T023_NEMVE|nr:predicted protein [Nematostella vectensis]|eukprot:XP_001622791.1 hypothetical protein NEMVEDRAFT_v1g248295 [Nematostella vectensis]
MSRHHFFLLTPFYVTTPYDPVTAECDGVTSSPLRRMPKFCVIHTGRMQQTKKELDLPQNVSKLRVTNTTELLIAQSSNRDLFKTGVYSENARFSVPDLVSRCSASCRIQAQDKEINTLETAEFYYCFQKCLRGVDGKRRREVHPLVPMASSRHWRNRRSASHNHTNYTHMGCKDIFISASKYHIIGIPKNIWVDFEKTSMRVNDSDVDHWSSVISWSAVNNSMANNWTHYLVLWMQEGERGYSCRLVAKNQTYLILNSTSEWKYPNSLAVNVSTYPTHSSSYLFNFYANPRDPVKFEIATLPPDGRMNISLATYLRNTLGNDSGDFPWATTAATYPWATTAATYLGQRRRRLTLGQRRRRLTLGQRRRRLTLGQRRRRLTLGQRRRRLTLGQRRRRLTLGNDGGDLPLGNDGGDLPLSNDGGDLPLGNDGGDLPLSNDGGDLPLGNDGGDLPLGNDGGDYVIRFYSFSSKRKLKIHVSFNKLTAILVGVMSGVVLVVAIAIWLGRRVLCPPSDDAWINLIRKLPPEARGRIRSATSQLTIIEEENTYYISYYPESDEYVKLVVKFVSFLRELDYDVIMDKMSAKVPQEGPIRWAQQQISTSSKIIVLCSPKYLKMCQMRPKEDPKAFLTEEESRVWYEIEMLGSIYMQRRNANKMVCIWMNKGVPEGLPPWMHVRYTWPADYENIFMRLEDTKS